MPIEVDRRLERYNGLHNNGLIEILTFRHGRWKPIKPFQNEKVIFIMKKWSFQMVFFHLPVKSRKTDT